MGGALGCDGEFSASRRAWRPHALPTLPQHCARPTYDSGRRVLLCKEGAARDNRRSPAVITLAPVSFALAQGGLVGEEAAVSTMMLSYGCMGIITLLWSWIGVRGRVKRHKSAAASAFFAAAV